jgi:hypothetical protein
VVPGCEGGACMSSQCSTREHVTAGPHSRPAKLTLLECEMECSQHLVNVEGNHQSFARKTHQQVASPGKNGVTEITGESLEPAENPC